MCLRLKAVFELGKRVAEELRRKRGGIRLLEAIEAYARTQGFSRVILETGTAQPEAIALYERGSALRQHCAARLDAAQARIESIRLGADGAPAGTAPFDAG